MSEPDTSSRPPTSDRSPSSLVGRMIERVWGFHAAIKVLVLGVLPVAGYTIGVWLDLESGMELVSSGVTRPEVAYEVRNDNILRPTAAFEEEFMRLFAEVYFGRSDHLPRPFAVQSVDSAVDRSGFVDHVRKTWSVGLTWKGVVQNKSRKNPIFVSSVDVRVRNREVRRFPWSALPVTPEVDIYHQVGSASVFVRSSGAGPALNVSWKVESQTLGVISSGEHPMLTDTSTVRYAEIDECGHMASSQYWSLEVHEGDRLESPLGLFGPTSWVLTDSSGSVSVTVEEEPRFWAIGSLEKLRDFATVAPSGDSLTVSVGFESLSGESYTRDTTVLIPEGRVLVRRDSDSLVVKDCQWSASRLDRPIEELLLAVVPSRFTGADQLKTPSGVDVLVERFQLDVGGLGNGEEMIASRNPDVFLNPRGALSVYLDLDRPANGTYDVELLVNGEPVESVMLEALVPPDNALRFKPEHVDWFRPDSSATETLGSSPR